MKHSRKRALLVLRITLGLFLLQCGVEKFVVPQNTIAIWDYFYGLNVPQTLGYVFGAVEIATAGCLFIGLFRTAAFGATRARGYTMCTRCSTTDACSRRASVALARVWCWAARVGPDRSATRRSGAAIRRVTGAGSPPACAACSPGPIPVSAGTRPTSAGFYGEQPDAELFVRWAQAAVFASHMRFHGIGAREPWAFGEEALGRVRAALDLQDAPRPYIEACLEEATRTGLPITRCMALAFRTSPKAGPSICNTCLARICWSRRWSGPRVRFTLWLPAGDWLDAQSGERLTGARRLDRALRLDQIALMCGAVPRRGGRAPSLKPGRLHLAEG